MEKHTLTSEGRSLCPVNSYNEWDPLEEVIVGVVDGAAFPPYHIVLEPTMPHDQLATFRENAGKPFPPEQIAMAKQELEEFVHILEGEGVRVRRPTPSDQLQQYGAPGWTSTGLYDAMPRDVLLAIGDEIIECPLAWRSRHYGAAAFKPLLKEYFKQGAKWSAAPSPELKDELYDYEWTEPEEGDPARFVITEFEPTFDAADFVRCGRDIFAQESNVTNKFGIEWLRRHLGDTYRIHVFEFKDRKSTRLNSSHSQISYAVFCLKKKSDIWICATCSTYRS